MFEPHTRVDQIIYGVNPRELTIWVENEQFGLSYVGFNSRIPVNIEHAVKGMPLFLEPF